MGRFTRYMGNSVSLPGNALYFRRLIYRWVVGCNLNVIDYKGVVSIAVVFPSTVAVAVILEIRKPRLIIFSNRNIFDLIIITVRVFELHSYMKMLPQVISICFRWYLPIGLLISNIKYLSCYHVWIEVAGLISYYAIIPSNNISITILIYMRTSPHIECIDCFIPPCFSRIQLSHIYAWVHQKIMFLEHILMRQ